MMSEKFGLDWKEYELKRMASFIIIMNEINKINNDRSKT